MTNSTTPHLTTDPDSTDPGTSPAALDFFAGPVALAQALVDIPSTSHEEKSIADAIEEASWRLHNAVDPHCRLRVERFNNNIMIATNFGHDSRVILAGHIDTVPAADNVPSTMVVDNGEDILYGCGSVDMKSGDAVFLSLLAELSVAGTLTKDVTVICYEAEEVADRFNGLGHIAQHHPEWLVGDVAILGEPSGGVIEGGCQGSIRLKVSGHGQRAHSARSWLGRNAFHALAPVISRIVSYQAQSFDIDGLTYREGLNITWAECGVATNTIPDEAWFFVNYRFAPHRSEQQALEHLLEILEIADTPDVSYVIDDTCPGALPGLHHPVAEQLVVAAGGNARAKFGWTDVARFSALGIPAVNFGPGDPALCHTRDEHCPVSMITDTAAVLRRYLTSET